MSIHFISGKPRGGKSLYAVKLLVEELVHGKRVVITNLPLKLGPLNEYIQREFPKASVNLLDRVILLSDEETQHFWTVRPNGVRVGVLSADDWKAGLKPDYSAVHDEGVFFVIDEIHNFFNARAWMETGKDVLFYLSQHGKLGDTVICITQHVGNVDKQFRSVTQDYTYLRNMAKERMGLFKLPGIFVRKTYLQPATDKSEPMETGSFRLDVSGLASCYDTAQGVGIHGRAADKTERRSGLPWWVFVVGAPALIVGFLHFMPQVFCWATTPDLKRAPAAVSPAPSAVPVSPPPARPAHEWVDPVKPAVPVSVPAAAAHLAVESSNRVYVSGWGLVNGHLRIALSDGRMIDGGDPEVVKGWGAGGLVLAGEGRIPLKPGL